MISNLKEFVYRTPTGQAHIGDDPPPPDGSTLLVAPGGQIQDDLAKRYGVYEQLAGKSGKGKAPVARSSTGEPLVTHTEGGRAYAANVLDDDDERKKAAMEAARKEDEAKAGGEKVGAEVEEDDGDEGEDEPDDDESGVKVRKEAEAKAIRLGQGGVQDKAVSGPPQSKRGPGRPARGK
jgi:hypothetical protein